MDKVFYEEKAYNAFHHSQQVGPFKTWSIKEATEFNHKVDELSERIVGPRITRLESLPGLSGARSGLMYYWDEREGRFYGFFEDIYG